MQISNNLSMKIKYHCGVEQGGNLKSNDVVSQVMVDLEDSYVRWSDEVFCRGTGVAVAECPCVEV